MVRKEYNTPGRSKRYRNGFNILFYGYRAAFCRAFAATCMAGLSWQAGAGELDRLCHTLSELDAGFDQRLGRKIQMSTQIGNLQIPEIRSFFLSKLTVMGGTPNVQGVDPE